MTILNWLRRLFSSFFKRGPLQKATPKNRPLKPRIFYNSIKIISKTPPNDSIGKRDFIAVIYEGKPYWILFQCPCGCGKVISLSSQTIHKPYWRLRKTTGGRPTVHPSIWQNSGCCSHFWIKDGRIYFCNNTGVEPWTAKPDIYLNPKEKKSVKGSHWQA